MKYILILLMICTLCSCNDDMALIAAQLDAQDEVDQTIAISSANETALNSSANYWEDKAGQPLFFVDGMPFENDSLRTLNPSQIKEITILKGEKASAEYGTDAANGVVLITLK